MSGIESIFNLLAERQKTRRSSRENRGRNDRRVRDMDPPESTGERRIRPDRRFPEVSYVEIDEVIEIQPVKHSAAGFLI